MTLGQSLKRLSVELSSTLRIRIFSQHLGMYLGGYIAQDVFNAVFTYYVVFVLMQSPTVASNLMGTMAILQFLAVIGMIPLCIRLGPDPSYRLVVCLFGLAAMSYGVLYYSGLQDVFSLLLGNATRRFLLQVLESQIEALAQYQDDSGLWHTLLDDANSYVESSANAGFAYGILKAVRKRYVDKRYAEMAEKAIRGVIANINPQGELVNVSFGTAMGRDLDYYRQIPLTSMPYGQAMVILCLSEYLRVYL